jgi:ketosteroid isomerase-like protein
MSNRNAWLDAWEEHRLDLEEVVEEGDDVVDLVHLTARGTGSGVEVDVRFYAQFKVRNGKVIAVFDHEDRAAALEAAGLSRRQSADRRARAGDASWPIAKT